MFVCVWTLSVLFFFLYLVQLTDMVRFLGSVLCPGQQHYKAPKAASDHVNVGKQVPSMAHGHPQMNGGC